MVDLVQLELAGLRIGLRECAIGVIGTNDRNVRVERPARRVELRALEALGRILDRDLGEDLVAGLGRDQAQEGRFFIRIGDDDDT